MTFNALYGDRTEQGQGDALQCRHWAAGFRCTDATAQQTQLPESESRAIHVIPTTRSNILKALLSKIKLERRALIV